VNLSLLAADSCSNTGYFLLGDSLNTTVTVIATLQNSIVAYNTLQLTYLLIVGIAAQVSLNHRPMTSKSNKHPQAVGIYAFWWIQQRFKLGTKTMFNTIAVGIILLDGWGMIGIWTDKFGFHNTWEVWVRPPPPQINNPLTNPNYRLIYRSIKHSTVSSSAPGTATRKS
jgi:hypothetical protein